MDSYPGTSVDVRLSVRASTLASDNPNTTRGPTRAGNLA